MGKKLHWFARDAARHLSDPEVLSLTWPAKGVLDIMDCVLWTITDTPGYFIKKKKILNQRQILELLRMYQGGGKDADLDSGFGEILEAELLEQRNDGCFYAARIVEEHEASVRAQRAGKASAQKRSVGQSVEQNVEQSVALHNSTNITKQNSGVERNVEPTRGEYSEPTPIDELPDAKK